MPDHELERQYFARGKEICGAKSGGLLARMLKAKGGNIALARSIIEMAATKENPREWFMRAVHNAEPQAIGGATALAWNHRAAAMLAERQAAKVPTEAEKATVARRAAEFHRHVPPDAVPPKFSTGQPTSHGERVAADLAARRTLAGQADALAAREDPAAQEGNA